MVNTLFRHPDYKFPEGWGYLWFFPDGDSGKEPTCQCRRHKRLGFDPWVGKIPWRRAGQPTPVLLPGESHGQRSLVGWGPWGCYGLSRKGGKTRASPVARQGCPLSIYNTCTSLLAPYTMWLKQQNCVFSPLWRPGVWDVHSTACFWGPWGWMFYACHLASGDFLSVFDIPWLTEASPNLCLHLHMSFSLCACLFKSPLMTSS